jgi:hypothetical protein
MRMTSQALIARSVVARAPRFSVRTVDGCAEVDRYGIEADGSLVLVAPAGSALVAEVRRAYDDVPVVVDAADLCPDAGHLRALVRLGGWASLAGWIVGSGDALLRVEVGEVVLVTGEEPVDVDPADYAYGSSSSSGVAAENAASSAPSAVS